MRVALLTIAVLLALPTGSPATVPKDARRWIGTWSTNFGRVFIPEVIRKKSEIPDANGNPQYYWGVEAYWTPEDGDRRVIEAGLGGRNGSYDTLQGCWTPSPENTNCARILVFRKGDKITGGYWKNCRDYCKSHHPWQGVKRSGAFRVGFQFTQRGPKDGDRNVRTQSGGAGAIVAEDESDLDGLSQATTGTRVFHLLEDGQARTTIEVVNGELKSRGPRRTGLDLFGKVVRSDLNGCPAGTIVTVELTEGHGGATDRVVFKTLEDSCLVAGSWTSLDPHRVNVRIDAPRETG